MDLSGRAQFIDELYAELQARSSDGAYRFDDDEVADLLGCLVVCSLAAGATDPITRREEDLLVRFAARLGIRGGETAEQLERIFRERLGQLAISQALLSKLRETARALLTGTAAPAPAQQRLLGRSKKLQPLSQARPAAGTVRAGPAARFQLDRHGTLGAQKKKQKSAPVDSNKRRKR